MKSRINPRCVITPKLIGYCIEEYKKDPLIKIAQQINVDICFVGTESAGEITGYIAGINGIRKNEHPVENPPECEILIMSGLKSTLIDRLLKILREQGIFIDLKCTLTPTNQNWEVRHLADELIKEHEKLNGRQA